MNNVFKKVYCQSIQIVLGCYINGQVKNSFSAKRTLQLMGDFILNNASI